MTATPDMAVVKTRMKHAWEAGDYGTFATYMEPGAVDLLKVWGVEPGQRLLDVGCGAGQLALPAARMGLEATGVDIATNLVARARERAAAEGLGARFDEGDAEALPYEDDSFDIVASIFGAMFAPRPERVAAELQRVCRPGGRILMGNWTPTSFPAHMCKTVSRYVPPPNVPPPVLWGDEAVVRERLADASEIRVEKRLYSKWTYPFPPPTWWTSSPGTSGRSCEPTTPWTRRAAPPCAATWWKSSSVSIAARTGRPSWKGSS